LTVLDIEKHLPVDERPMPPTAGVSATDRADLNGASARGGQAGPLEAAEIGRERPKTADSARRGRSSAADFSLGTAPKVAFLAD
jgi:hypothetical protein